MAVAELVRQGFMAVYDFKTIDAAGADSERGRLGSRFRPARGRAPGQVGGGAAGAPSARARRRARRASSPTGDGERRQPQQRAPLRWCHAPQRLGRHIGNSQPSQA